jgi:prevent-host-death family protein
MIRETSAMTVRQKFGELLNEVQYRRDRVLITKAGKPVAALIDIALFEKLRKLDEEFERLIGGIRKAFAKTPPQKGMALLDEAVRAARKSAPINEGGARYQRAIVGAHVPGQRARQGCTGMARGRP